MARGDLVLSLVKAALSGDMATIEEVIKALVADDFAKKRNSQAERMDYLLRTVKRPNPMVEFNKGNAVGTLNRAGQAANNDYLMVKEPKRMLDDLILSDLCLMSCRELVEEQKRADVLRGKGLEPRHRVLLIGPPGNGKTSLAEALAYELEIGFCVIRYESVIGSYLGETASRLNKVFKYVVNKPCVLFFDEFDTLGKERGDDKEMGEIKRVVSSLLLQVDDLPSHVVIIGATNHPELLDRAVWRRFQLKLEMLGPEKWGLMRYLEKMFQGMDGFSSEVLERIAEGVFGLCFSEVESFCLDIKRKLVLSRDKEGLSGFIERGLLRLGKDGNLRRHVI